MYIVQGGVAFNHLNARNRQGPDVCLAIIRDLERTTRALAQARLCQPRRQVSRVAEGTQASQARSDTVLMRVVAPGCYRFPHDCFLWICIATRRDNPDGCENPDGGAMIQ